jgi:glycosyltransferase involved in cell wall biosynthesis
MSRQLIALAWCEFQPRTQALARTLGGEAHFIIAGRRLARGLLPIRYVIDASATWRLLDRRDPGVVIAVSPPFLAPMVAWLWCGAHRRTLVIDCHTDAFSGSHWGWTKPIHRWLARRCAAVTLHTAAARDEVAGWGTPALLLPDDLPDSAEAAAASTPAGPMVLVAGGLDSEEPVAATLAAARLMPEVEFRLTGDPRRLGDGIVAGAPENAHFTGWLDYPKFLGQVQVADVVAALTHDAGIMNRAAYEAVGLGKPIVLSNSPGRRERFGAVAVFTANTPAAIASAVRQALEEKAELGERSRGLRAELAADHEQGIATLREILGDAGRGPLSGRRLLMITQHPYPQNPTVRRNVEYALAQGAEVDLVCTRESAETARPAPGLRLHALRLAHRRFSAAWYPLEYLAFFFRALPRVTALSVMRRYDVVQVDNLPDFLVFAAAPARWRGARVVFFMYELMPEMTASRLKVGSQHPLVKLVEQQERWATAWADRVITVNELCRRQLLKRGVDDRKLTVVTNTQPAAQFGEAVPGPEPLLITHATLTERYGVQVAIAALADLRRKWPDLRLEVLGEGEYRPQLEMLVGRLGLEEVVDFRGFLPWEDAMAHVRRASVGVVCVISDGYGDLLLPNKLFDYVTQGVPVACARLAAIADHFPPDTLAYFTPGDAVELAVAVDRLLGDPAGARCQADRAREAARQLSWENVAGGYLDVLSAAR